MLKDFAFVVYPVSDIAKSRHFYCDLLGVKESGNWQGAWLELEVGHGTLALTTRYAELGILPGANGAVLALEVDDLAEFAASLEKHGVDWYSKPVEYPNCHGAMVKDPDGNRVLLHQKKAKTQPSGKSA